MICNVVVYYKT